MEVKFTSSKEIDPSAIPIEVLDKRREGRILLKRRVIYRLSDKGRRILEICEDLSEEEAKELLDPSPFQLDILRRLKDGSKRAADFPYSARYSLERMVERGLLTRTVEGVDADELRRMRSEGLKNREITEKLGISPSALQYWIKKLNLEKKKRASPENWIKIRNRIYILLRKNGPMPKREVMKTLGLKSDQIEMILAIFQEEFQKLNFTVKGKKYSKRFHDLFKASPVLTLRDDPRIVDFAASKINMKVKTQYEAKSIFQLLKWQLGTRQAHAVVERLGYRYKENTRLAK